MKRTFLIWVSAAVALQGLDHAVLAQAPVEKEVPFKTIGYCSRELLIVGWDADAVKKSFGPPTYVSKKDFARPINRHPELLPAGVDEQWTYSPKGLRHQLIYFVRGKVILAVDEWSDF